MLFVKRNHISNSMVERRFFDRMRLDAISRREQVQPGPAYDRQRSVPTNAADIAIVEAVHLIGGFGLGLPIAKWAVWLMAATLA